MKKAFLLLADGTLLEGQAVGYEGRSLGEIVFNTGMAGYQRVLTDPSYYGQTVCMTYPLIGNYGINFEDCESQKSWVSGFIMREISEHPSNWRCQMTLDAYLKDQKIVGLAGIDTRHLTRILRDRGVMNGMIYTEGFEPDADMIAKIKTNTITQAVQAVTCTDDTVYPAEGKQQYRVALYDYGAKSNVEQELCKRGCEVTVVSALTTPEEIESRGFDGVMLSNGPGDPAENTEIIENLKLLAQKNIPIFGISLGHQLMSLALGAKTEKLKYGHRGANQPVKDLDTDRTFITSQNHGYAVIGDSVDSAAARVRYVNLNDGTVEGLEYRNRPIFTVQFYPETGAGPMDTSYLYDHFIENIAKVQGGARECH